MESDYKSTLGGAFLPIAVAALLLTYLAMHMCHRLSHVRAKTVKTSPMQPIRSLFQELPSDMIRRVAEQLADERIADITAFCQTSHCFRHLRTEAERTWLCWQPKCTVGCQLLNDRLSVQRIKLACERGPGHPLRPPQHTAAGNLLPAAGRYSWTIRVGRSAFNSGMLSVGVCDAGIHYGWGLRPGSGELAVKAMAGSGPPPHKPDYGVSLEPLAACPLEQLETVADSPGGHWRCVPVNVAMGVAGQVIPKREALGRQNPANSKADVEVVVDRDAGTVAFRLNGGPLSASLTGFPPGVMLRPWVSLDSVCGAELGDLATFASPLRLHGGASVQ